MFFISLFPRWHCHKPLAQFHSTIKTGVAKRKISQKLQKSRQDHAQDQVHSDAWGPLRKAVADYKKEGRVITKESYLKELQEFLNHRGASGRTKEEDEGWHEKKGGSREVG